jgi:uncharacterized protein (TIGR01777 family)
MRVVITGSTGFIGSALVGALRGDGHEVVRLVRRPPRAPDEARWDPSAGTVDSGALRGADAVVHLAGVGIGDRRWNDEHRRAVLASRVDGTTTIARAIAEVEDGPRTLLSASAIGFYGDTGEDTVDESASAGEGFLADVVRQWEACTAPAADAGVRVVLSRTGVVLSSAGGALAKVLPLFKAGLGGRLGSGRQWMSWIALPDEIAAIRFLLAREDLSGPFNLTAPEPVTNRDYTAAIARAVHRPTVFPVPASALRVVLGGFADEGVLVSQRVVPRRLEEAGFGFTYDDIDAAVRAVI